jgi:predicted RNase H-like HicB family nuclease
MMRRFIAAVFADPEDSGYVATVPRVPGVVGQGETEVEAYEDVTKALEFHLESIAIFGKGISEEPTPTSTRTIELTV